MSRLLDLRKRMKAKRPRFVRQDAFRFAKLENREHWRKPRGRHSKIRAKKKGQPTMVRWGFASPREVRGLMRTGHQPVYVFNENDIKNLDPKKQVAIVGGAVGMRKRLAIVAAAQKAGLSIWNINVASFHNDLKRDMDERKKVHKALLARREKKREEKAKKPKKEETKEPDKTPEKAAADIDEKKKEDRLEAEKVIIHK